MTAQIGVRIGPAACARALSQQGRGLRLEIDTTTGDTVTIWSSSSELTTAADTAFARTLLDAADRFLAECERHTAPTLGLDTPMIRSAGWPGGSSLCRTSRR